MSFQQWFNSAPHRQKYKADHPAYLAAHEAWKDVHEACALLVEKMGIEGYGTLAIAAAIRMSGDEPAHIHDVKRITGDW